MVTAYINRIETAVPAHDVHARFLRYAFSMLDGDEHSTTLLRRLADRSGIERRYSCLAAPPEGVGEGALDGDSFYERGRFPDTATRMRLFETRAPALAAHTIDKLTLGSDCSRVTHLLITCCTGFSAPGLDIEVIERCNLPGSVERTIIGFMGCYAALNALKLARHIVRSEPAARVLILNIELCTLHLQETRDLAQLLCFLLFSDGCAASLVTADPSGIAIDQFRSLLLPDTRQLMSWNVRNNGFDMVLSGYVPTAIHAALRNRPHSILPPSPGHSNEMWAVHAGGRTILDAVERALDLHPTALAPSRDVLRRYGNMSSATVMFVLESLMRSSSLSGDGCAMSFGPGLIAETMRFRKAA